MQELATTPAGNAIGCPTRLSPASAASASDCLPIHEAGQHVGETKCVTGKVLRVKVGAKGVHFIDFCEDQMACPFTVVVFPSDLKDVGDVRRLAGHVIEIRGPVKLYDGRSDVNYILTGRLEKLEEVDYQGGVKVEVAISAQMTSLATGGTVWTNAVSEVGTVAQHDVPAVVSEMNQTMNRAIEKLLTPPPASVTKGN